MTYLIARLCGKRRRGSWGRRLIRLRSMSTLWQSVGFHGDDWICVELQFRHRSCEYIQSIKRYRTDNNHFVMARLPFLFGVWFVEFFFDVDTSGSFRVIVCDWKSRNDFFHVMLEENEPFLKLPDGQATLCRFGAQFFDLAVDTVNTLDDVRQTLSNDHFKNHNC